LKSVGQETPTAFAVRPRERGDARMRDVPALLFRLSLHADAPDERLMTLQPRIS
jgi:hypothetical protein